MLSAALMLAVAAPAAPGGGLPGKTVVFQGGEGGYACYRIPAIVRTGSGVLLAFCEGRKNSAADSGDIDLLLRRSTDNGATWGRATVVWEDGPHTCGNPCPVADRATGRILLLGTWNRGDDSEPRIITGTSVDTRRVFVLESADDGLTWSRAREITATAKQPDWTWYATGPGAGIQIEHGPHRGRLVIPCDHIEAGTKRYFSHVIFSDDQGRSWMLGGRSPKPMVNECEVVELAGGRLLLNMRNYDAAQRTRQICSSDDGGATWTDQRHDPVLVEPICQASIRRIAWPRDGQPGVIVFSNPADGRARRNLTLRASFDDAATWPRSLVVDPGGAAYSCLVALPPSSVGCLYETAGYRQIAFVPARLDQFAP